MTFEIALLLVFLAATLALFLFEVLPVEVTAMCLLAALLLSGIVTLEEALTGLSNEAVVTVGAMFVLSHALAKTGLLELGAQRLAEAVGPRSWLGVALLLGAAGLMSGVLNNTAVVAVLIPLAVDLCRRFDLNPSRVLIPLSYTSIFGGTLTLIGTSTNLLVSTISHKGGEGRLGMFEFAALGAVFLAVGLVYVLAAGPRFLPTRAAAVSLTRKYSMAPYLTELRVLGTSKLVGRTVRELDLSSRYDLTVLAVVREGERLVRDLQAVRFEADDVLLVRGSVESLLKVRSELGVALLTDIKLNDREFAEGGQVVVEGLVPPNSPLIGNTLEELDFRRRYGAFVLAIRRLGATLHTRLARTPLRFSDTLLMVSSRDRLDDLRRQADLVITSELDLHLRRHRFWWLVLALLPAVMVLAALGIVPIAAGALVACVTLLAVGALSPRETYRSVDWSVLFFIAAFVPLGDAMFKTGAADFLGAVVLAPVGWIPAELAPWVAVSLVYLVTSLMTELITNNAAAILMTPVAIGMAHELGVDPRPFVFAVCFAASASFMTPTGYQTNMMVYGPGSYRFTDFTRFGAPLNLLFWLLASLLIPRFWPFG